LRILSKYFVSYFDIITLAKLNSKNFKDRNQIITKYISVIYGVIYFIAFLWLKVNNHWTTVSVPAMFPDYADLRTVTSAVDCRNNEDYIDEYVSNCDPWSRPFNYPGIWVTIFHRLNLGTELTGVLGIIFLLLVALSLSYWCFVALESKLTLMKLLVFSGFIYSPSIYLLNERGNVDALIFTLITLTLYLYRNNFKRTAILLVTFGSVLKIFPLILLLTIGVRNRSIVIRLLCLLGGTISCLYLVPILPKILSNTPSTSDYSFGLITLIGEYFPTNFESQTKIIVTFSLFMGVVSLLFFLTRNFVFQQNRSRSSHISSLDSHIFIIIWPMFIFIYTTLTSFNYRIVFLVPIVALLLRFNSNTSIAMASFFMPYVILAMHLGPSSKLLALTLFAATATSTYFWLGLLCSNRKINSYTEKSELAN